MSVLPMQEFRNVGMEEGYQKVRGLQKTDKDLIGFLGDLEIAKKNGGANVTLGAVENDYNIRQKILHIAAKYGLTNIAKDLLEKKDPRFNIIAYEHALNDSFNRPETFGLILSYLCDIYKETKENTSLLKVDSPSEFHTAHREIDKINKIFRSLIKKSENNKKISNKLNEEFIRVGVGTENCCAIL